MDLLEKYNNGELCDKRNVAVVALGHGRLENARGDTLDIGGSTGGLSRRVIDSWQPPDHVEFLRQGRI